MRKELTSTALALALLVAGAGWAQAQNTGGSGDGASSDNDRAATTGTMTTTPRDTRDDAILAPQAATNPGDATGMATTDEMRSDSALYGMRSSEIVGKTLYGAGGEEIGEISNVVVSQGMSSPEAVVDVGGFLGIGAREVTIPLSQIDMQGDRLVTMMTKDVLNAREEYSEDRYQLWGSDRTFGSAE